MESWGKAFKVKEGKGLSHKAPKQGQCWGPVLVGKGMFSPSQLPPCVQTTITALYLDQPSSLLAGLSGLLPFPVSHSSSHPPPTKPVSFSHKTMVILYKRNDSVSLLCPLLASSPKSFPWLTRPCVTGP